MIQIYSPSNTEYEKNGDMTLTPISAIVHPVLNGSWEAVIEHPIDADDRWKYIVEDAVVKMPSFNGEQLFRIKQKEKSDSGVIATLEPIFFDSMNDCFLVDVRPTGKTGQQALDLMLGQNARYSAQSNIAKTATAYYQYKNFMEALNGDEDNSFINRWGGEILFDNFTVIVNEHVGGDYGVELRYGKNIPVDGLTEAVDTRDVITRIYPKAYNGYTIANNGYVDSPLLNNYPTIRTATITFPDVKMRTDARDGDEDEGIIICDDQDALNAALIQRCNEQYSAGLDKPTVTIRADMVVLKDTELYKDYAVLEDIALGDTIHCINHHLGIVTDARVIELEYDAIRKRVSSVIIGDFSYNYFNNVSSAVNRVDKAIRPDGTVMAERIAGFIDGAMAGLRAQYNAAQKQDVMAILFENLDSTSPLYGAMALGTQGLMISKTRSQDGRSWDWTTAMTAGGLIANVIVAGILSDRNGKNYWNLDTSEFSLSAEGFKINGQPADQYFKSTWTQEEVFNKLTDNGKIQGIFMRDGQLYINASYIGAGTFVADYIKGGTLRLGGSNNVNGAMIIINAAGDQIGRWDKDGISASQANISGTVTASEGRIGEWYIVGGNLTNGLPYTGAKDSNATGMGSYGGGWAFWAGNGRFSVNQAGKLHAEDADITGNVNATSGSFSGTVNASSGVFDNVTVRNSSISGSSFSGSAGTVSGGTYTSPYISGGSMASTGGTYVGTCSGSTISNCSLGGTSLATGNGGGYFRANAYGAAVMYGPNTAQVQSGGSVYITGDSIGLQQGPVTVYSSLSVRGEKNRSMQTQNFGWRNLSALETPMPTFSDYGIAQVDENGCCYIVIDPVFAEVVDAGYMPVTFLSKYGQGELWIDEENSGHDVIAVRGTPGLRFSWETRYQQMNVYPERMTPTGMGEPGIGEYDYAGESIVEIEHENVDYGNIGMEYAAYCEAVEVDYASEGYKYYEDYERSLIVA